jgi:hypothetical protein
MNINNFNLYMKDAMNYAIEVIRSEDELSKSTNFSLLELAIDNIVEELNTIVEGKVRREALLKNFLDEANLSFTKKSDSTLDSCNLGYFSDKGCDK